MADGARHEPEWPRMLPATHHPGLDGVSNPDETRPRRATTRAPTETVLDRIVDVCRALVAALCRDHAHYDPLAAYAAELSQGREAAWLHLLSRRDSLLSMRNRWLADIESGRRARLTEIDTQLTVIEGELTRSAEERAWSLSL